MRKILITGGELENKGAQSMTFITVDELKKRFPNHSIVMNSPFDVGKSKDIKDNYKFDIEVMGNVPPVLKQMSLKQRLYYLVKGYDSKSYTQTKKSYEDIDLLVDISGYGLGSDWSDDEVKMYLYRIMCAKYFGIKVILMPQSFGPFNYKGIRALRMNRLIRKVLKYPDVICAREQEGYDILTQKYGLNNVIKTYDIVLNNKSVDLSNIYVKVPKMFIPEIKENSVAIIPNRQNLNYCNEKNFYLIYKRIIDGLLQQNKNIYIITHSNIDRDICKSLSEISNKITYIDREISCIEFNQIVPKFDYVIASRYHSVVHSYKNAVPCITIGWATKYQELHDLFEQSEYFFDIRECVDLDSFMKKLDKMEKSHTNESRVILDKLRMIQDKNIFDILNLE